MVRGPDSTGIMQDGLEREGLAWVSRVLSGQMAVSEIEDLLRWRSSSAAHREAYAKAVRLHKMMQRRVELRPERGAAPVRRPYHLDRRIFLAGAGLAGAAYLAVRPPAHLWPSWDELRSDYRTGTGEQRQVALATGVSLDLNTKTSINKVESGRAVALISGQAALKAAGRLNAPAAIMAGRGTTLLHHGTVDIYRDDAMVRVTCAEGAAIVRHPSRNIRLPAGYQVTYTDDNLVTPHSVDASVTMAWQRGLLIFRDQPLQEVVREINRYRAGRIIIADEAIGRRSLYGVFEIAHLDRAVEQIRRFTGAKFTELPAGVVVIG